MSDSRPAAAASPLLLPCTAIGVAALDQASKAWIVSHMGLGQCYATLLGFLDIRFVTNRGAAFGMMAGNGPFFVAVAVLVLAGMAFSYRAIRQADPWLATALGLLAGGTVGNVVDRLRLGYVVDFLDLRWWPVFNLADSAICVGVAIMIVKILHGEPTPATSDAEAGSTSSAGASLSATSDGAPQSPAHGTEPPSTPSGGTPPAER